MNLPLQIYFPLFSLTLSPGGNLDGSHPWPPLASVLGWIQPVEAQKIRAWERGEEWGQGMGFLSFAPYEVTPHWRSPPSLDRSLLPGSTGQVLLPARVQAGLVAATNPRQLCCPLVVPPTTNYTFIHAPFIMNHLVWVCICFSLEPKCTT